MKQGPSRYSMRNVSMDMSCVGLCASSFRFSFRKFGQKRGYAPVAVAHEIQDVSAAPDEEDFHDEVVQGDPAIQKVEIAGHEDTNIEGLRFERYTCRKQRQQLFFFTASIIGDDSMGSWR